MLYSHALCNMCMHIYIYTLFFMSVCVCMYVCVYTWVCIYTYVCVLYHQPLVSACGCNVIISTFALNPYKPQWEIAHKSQLAMCAISSLFAAGNGKRVWNAFFNAIRFFQKVGVKSQFVPIYPVFQDICPEFPRGISQKRYMSSRNHRCSSNFGGIPRSKASGFQIIIANP